MNAYKMNIGDEILENVSGGRPIGRDGKPISPAEYRRLREGIQVTTGTFGPDDDDSNITTTTYYM